MTATFLARRIWLSGAIVLRGCTSGREKKIRCPIVAEYLEIHAISTAVVTMSNTTVTIKLRP